MKKIFSIFGMVLVSLALHATLVTHEINLSEISSQGDAKWENPTITANAWQGVQKWFGDAEYAFDASEYEVLVLELDEASSVGVNYVINYADGSANNDLTIPAGETSAQLALKSSKIQKIVIQLTASGSAKIGKLYFQGTAGKVSEESVAFDLYNNDGALGNWNNSLQAWSGRFSSLGLQVDDKLVIKYTLSGSDDQFRILACAESDNVFDFASANGSCVHPEAGTTSIAFSLNSADLALLTSKGLKIDGTNMTITGMSVLKHAVLWTGEQALGEWTNAFDIPASKLSNLQVGNILCFCISAIGTEASPRVTLAYGDSWNSFDPTIEYYFQAGDEAPMTVEFPVTYKMLQQLKNNKLVVRGVNYTVTDIYVKEGTPVNNVAAYLSVTSAGMATFIVPFNVLSLPEGVQAYTLTNDGSNVILATEVNALTADQPVLIVADEDEYEFLSENGASDDISEKTGTYTNGALVGTYVGINPIPVSEGVVNNYVLQNGSEGVAFYQVTAANCSIPAYRAYLSCAYDASDNGANHAPRMRIVFQKGGTTGIDNPMVNGKSSNRKLIMDGQLFIMREEELYTIQGQHIK